MQGPGVCIRKISGSVEVTSGSAPTFLQSQIFYVRTSEGHALPYRGFQLPPCPGALSVSALRAGALALAPTCTRPRTGRRAGPAWRPVRPLALSCGGQGHAFFAESAGKRLLPWEGGKRAAEGARKKKQKREKEAKSAAAAAPEEGSESDKKPLGRPPGRKDAAKRVRTEAEQQRDAAVTAGLVNALGGTQPPQKPEQLVLDGREPRGGEKRKQLFVAALFASFVCCSQMTNRSLRLSTQFM